jgi:ligand-binding sensor domain-containing protein
MSWTRALLAEEDRKKVEQDVQIIVENGDDKIWIDEAKGIFEYPYKTYVVVMGRR